jgi:hypothetical protein
MKKYQRKERKKRERKKEKRKRERRKRNKFWLTARVILQEFFAASAISPINPRQLL